MALVNVSIVAWHLLAAFWVSGGMNREILSAAAYEWPAHVVITSLSTGVLAVVLLVATVRLKREHLWPALASIAVGTLGALHVFEAAQLYATYGIGLHALSAAIWLPAWSVVLALYARGLRLNDSSTSPPLRGAA